MNNNKNRITATLISPKNLIKGNKKGNLSFDENLVFETDSKIISFAPNDFARCAFLKSVSEGKFLVRLSSNVNLQVPDVTFEFDSYDLFDVNNILENYGILYFDKSIFENEIQNKMVQIPNVSNTTQTRSSINKSEVNSQKYSDIRNPNLSCSICGAKPAGLIRLNSTAGRLVWSTTRKLDTNLCANCAEVLYLEQQRINLTQGWWAPRSAFTTPFYLVKNIFNIVTHRREIDHVLIEADQVPRHKLTVRRDAKSVLIGIFSIIFILFLIDLFTNSSDSRNSSDTKLGSCWEILQGDQLQAVSCSSSNADYVVTSVVKSLEQCNEWYIEYSTSEYGCLTNR